jgi:hypothetical protein
LEHGADTGEAAGFIANTDVEALKKGGEMRDVVAKAFKEYNVVGFYADPSSARLKEIDEKGRYNLSIKAADPEWARTKGVPEGQGGGRGDHGGRRDERHQDRHRRI